MTCTRTDAHTLAECVNYTPEPEECPSYCPAREGGDHDHSDPFPKLTDRIRAYESAVAHPYHVSAYRDWSVGNGVTVGFQTEAEARSFAAGRPEPLIDLARRGEGVIAVRRLQPHPLMRSTRGWAPRDDFPQVES